MKRTSLPLHRREFITLLGGAAAAWPLAARAQQATRTGSVISPLLLQPMTTPPPPADWDAFVQGLQRRGWTSRDATSRFEHRSAHDQPERLSQSSRLNSQTSRSM